ncbi:MAG: hypothetical protein AAFZ15_25350 [Bacteroidota bacterium]
MNRLALILISLIFVVTACHDHPELTQTPFQYFKDDNLVSVVIETNMGSLLAEKEDYEYQPAKLTLKKEDAEEEHFHLETKPRGHFRKATCTFPPLKIRFPDEVLESGGFKDYPTLKLVTHCEADLGFDQLILKEYLTFKLYNELTDNSFKNQLVKVTYVDTEDNHEKIERFGFLIEHPRELAHRMEGLIMGETYGVPKNIHMPAYKTFVLFQYMIGNTDWGLSNRHNVKLIQRKEGELKLPVPIPYDFDFCGLVNAPYAVPHHGHPIQHVRQRYFQWRGGEADFSEVFETFRSKQDKLIGIVADCEYLADSVKMDALNYLGDFFDQLETPEMITGQRNKMTLTN